MASLSAGNSIRLRGVRQNNLKGFDLDLPTRRLVVITGPSGSGKSSLAFDTLFAEGQRRYVETFSPYARQFFDRMDKPRVDSIEGIPPAVAVEQKNSVRSTRSTVGTMTELCDYLKVLWPQVSTLYCRSCGEEVRAEPPAVVWRSLPQGAEVVVLFEVPLSARLSLEESLALVQRQGFQRLMVGEQFVRIEEAAGELAKLSPPSHLTVVQDRLRTAPANRARFSEACEQAYHFGKGRLSIRWIEGTKGVSRRFSQHRHCARCDIEYRDPVPAMFSFNHPLGACPHCKGFGRIITIDYARAVPDRSRTLAQGVVRPWQSGMSAECQQDLMRFCRASGIPTNVPFERLSEDHQRWVIEGDPEYGTDEAHEWPQAWYGVKGYFRWLESKAYKMHVRVLLSRYRAYARCPACQGQRFQPETLLYRAVLPAPRAPRSLSLADFQRLPVQEALAVVGALAQIRSGSLSPALQLVLSEIKARLGYLEQVGLGYLTLDRPTRTLSGGETERVNLTTCLGTRLVNTLYVLDEPTVGLHARDTERLVQVLERLRDLGNTVVVVEHERRVIEAADHVVDLGPGHGESGGELVFQGSVQALGRCRRSLTGQYWSGQRSLSLHPPRPVLPEMPARLTVSGAAFHNLKQLRVELPLGRLVCLSGVSGSGKSTLLREVLYPLLRERLAPEAAGETGPRELDEDSEPNLEGAAAGFGERGQLAGWESLSQVILVDQSPVGRTPRSNPAVYVGAFDHIRDLFAASEEAQQRGLSASAFSFNSAQGQCERCRGAGFEKIEMQFLSDVFVRCPDCEGRRYRRHVLEVRLRPPTLSSGALSIGDLLGTSVDHAVAFLGSFDIPPAQRAAAALRWLQEVGLGYIQLGQPMNTLSGGESQRLKLVGALAGLGARQQGLEKPVIFLLDEPTTGLHFDDVRVLVEALQRLVDRGHTVVVVEHNLDVIGAADWVIDLGPEAGAGGGRIVVAGPPDGVRRHPQSHTGQALAQSVRSSPPKSSAARRTQVIRPKPPYPAQPPAKSARGPRARR